ncbi:MAG: efflux RND transporter periplasmic adaptor subunit [Kofleriaceae bacterium]|jgi:Cu(I)/Ag(I) efflux system membrane fusion protein|nr:efflux RND transporter periplasmic adaptor subunit [Kofleriaceae bacterium]MBP9169766.1 efflux RND transporter periplasmic adaptor subunit [Kofleriaceae bacterium]MBP9862221.1 efflux RND transporter periplasmic adaptor subunit [Kofleriaceae bacterium]
MTTATPPELEPTPPSPSPPPSPPRRRVSAGLAVSLVLAGMVVGAVGMRLVSGAAAPGGHAGAHPTTYSCPMHPTIVQDHPGDCPICGMALEQVEAAPAPAAAPPAGPRQVVGYRSPMDPSVISPTPRKDEMGMDYLPVYQDELAAGPPVAGLAPIDIDPGRQQLIGLRTAPVERARIGGQLRVVGRIAIDETRVRHVNVKSAGFVERIFVNYLGQRVRRGDPLFTLFSPDLLAAQEEYLLALRSRSALAGGGNDDAAQALIDAARRRLALWDVPASELRKLETTGRPIRAVTFYSPASGVVTKKDVVEGMKLEAGAMPYEIVDLSSVWVIADVYEAELRQVAVGVSATLTLTAYPGRSFAGTVAFLAPMLDPQTRTIKVRLSFANPSGDLRPEMFGEVVLSTAAHDALVVPADAIIDSGTSQVVFVAQGSGRFEPRQVELGQRDGAIVEVTRGLRLDERVVTRANFLIDSESRLRGSLSDLAAGADAGPERAQVLPGTGAAP